MKKRSPTRPDPHTGEDQQTIIRRSAMLVPDPTGCAECGMAYSFFFSTQYHRADCPVVKAVNAALQPPKAA